MRLRITGSLVVASLAFFSAAKSEALANRVFVSARSGNDANSCSNILTPCQTFAGAVLQLNPGGDAIVLDTGGYGPVTITQSLTIEAPPGVDAFIHPPSGDAITVNASGGTVVLRGLTIDGTGGSGNGITVNAVADLHIENCVITDFFGSGIAVNGGTNLFIKDTITRESSTGMFITRGRVSIDHCRVERNFGDGVYVDGAIVNVRDSVLAGNTGSGLDVQSTSDESSTLNVYECTSTNNGSDGFFAQASGIGVAVARVANSSISENVSKGLHNGGSATFESLGNNFVRGNFGGNVSGSVNVVSGQ